MLVAADAATGQTLALLITFLGIGVLVNLLIVWPVAASAAMSIRSDYLTPPSPDARRRW